jgi:hypothetical protein
MAKKLPFIVQPRRESRKIQIGSAESGVIEIEQRGYLTVSEKFYVNQITSDDKTLGLMVALANKISKETKRTNQESYDVIAKYLQGTADKKDAMLIDEKFSGDLQAITAEITRVAATRELAQVTVLMRSRVDDDWSTEDTFELHPDLLSGIAELYQKEEAREYPEVDDSTPEEGPAESEYEAALGKSEADQTPTS